MTTKNAQSEQAVKAELILSESQLQAFQDVAIAHGMSSDIRILKAEVNNFVIGDAA